MGVPDTRVQVRCSRCTTTLVVPRQCIDAMAECPVCGYLPEEIRETYKQ
ncbi:hypothetical protein [Halopiger djelfimassiliensis]|nr:hypothetical protein [Halopiger djelfimassiliensis]